MGADLREANLWRADLREANLRGADLWRADLTEANLREADLWRADLAGANLRGADLLGATLRGANLRDAKLPDFQIPQNEPLTAYKQCKGRLVTLLVPKEAKRTASLIGDKCRAEYAEVVAVEDFEAQGPAESWYKVKVSYAPEETVHPDGYGDDIRVECTNGIHFFMKKEDALSSGF